MEKERDHYSLQDLAIRWKKYPVSCEINDLLGLGAEGLIQFSVTKDKVPGIKSIVAAWHYYSGGEPTECPHHIEISRAQYVKLSKQTLANLTANPDDKALVDMYPWCTHCPLNRHPTNCLVEYKIKYHQEFLEALEDEELDSLSDSISCRSEDLVVTHGEVLRFEEALKSTLHPPYLNKEHTYYCYELALAVETWRDIFEFQRVDLKKTCKITVGNYITQKHPTLIGKLKGSGSVGRIATMLNKVPEKAFKDFKKQYQ